MRSRVNVRRLVCYDKRETMYDVFECEECGEEIGGRHGDDVTCPHCGTVSEPPDATPMYYDPWAGNCWGR